jgi:hypothetical protein
MKTPNYCLYETSFWLEILPEAHSTIRVRVLYHRLMNLLRSRGFTVGFDPFNGSKGYKTRRWGWQTSIGQCRDLHFAAQMHESLAGGKENPHAGRIEITFWQNTVLEKGRADGRHASGKLPLMPYLIRLHFQLTVRKIIAFLHETYPDTFTQDHSRIWPDQRPQVGYDYLMHSMRGWGSHLPAKGYDPFTFLPKNCGSTYLRDATGQPIVPGQIYHGYAGWHHTTLVQGRAVYSFNGNWLLYANDRSQHRAVYHNQLYPLSTPLPRRRKLALQEQLGKARARLKKLTEAQAFEKCISTRDFIRRHTSPAA